MSLKQYLKHYCEPEAQRDFSALPAYQHVLVIPAFNEPASLADYLGGLIQKQANLLIILVLNAPTLNNNCDLVHKALKQQFKEYQNIFFHQSSAILVVDRYSTHCIPKDQGVGLARKIGADIACALFDKKRLNKAWIHCTDADVILPSDYFQATELKHQSAALIYPFQHLPRAGEAGLAIQVYDFRLRYYPAALAWAKSPYAYPSIGSTLALNIDYYAKVRGFPKRAAGEDFHLLNKLAKLAPIEYLKGSLPIKIEDRTSHRVPFGTSTAVEALLKADAIMTSPMFENPKVFDALKTLIEQFEAFFLLGSVSNVLSLIDNTPITANALHKLGFSKALKHAFKQARTVEQFKRQLHTFFDALQTLRFLHFLRDDSYPDLCLADLPTEFLQTIKLKPHAQVLRHN